MNPTAPPIRSPNQRGFTRLELCGVLFALALLLIVAWPALAGNRTRSDRAVCANNLRQIGGAFHLWGRDYGDALPFDVRPENGGTLQHPLSANPWLHFSWISNELRSPKILSCPADATARVARDFSGDPTGGYVHPNFANRATGYFLTHAWFPTPTAVVAGDRNIKWLRPGGACSRFSSMLGVLPTFPRDQALFGWRAEMHEAQGNLLLHDGRVEQVNTEGFAQAIIRAAAHNSVLHVIIPR